MISVLNHLQQLSGNKLIVLVLCTGLLASCELFRPIQSPTQNKDEKEKEELDPIGGGRVYNPETGEFDSSSEVLVAAMDTIKWREVSTNEYPPITSGDITINPGGNTDVVISEGDKGTQFISTYNVSLFLPFLTDRFTGAEPNLDPSSRWAIEYYSGAKLAMEQLNLDGINLNVNVFDTKANPAELQRLFQNESEKIKKSHLLMGTVKSECVLATANYAKENKIPFVSPFTASSSITTENPYYIQINPTLRAHLKALVKHAKAAYNSDQILIVTPDNPDAIGRMKIIQELNAELAGNTYAPKFEEVIIKDKSLNLDKLNLNTLVRKGRETVFILPIWEDKNFIYAFLRKAYVADLQDQIVIYGMRQWQSRTFEDIEFSYLENLEVHISSEFFVDGYAVDVRDFKQRYFEQYGTPPSQEAFRGYDNMLYFGRMLNKHGTKFYEFFEEEKLPYFHTRYEFEPILKTTATTIRNERSQPVERYENGFIHILKFSDYYFQPINNE